LNQSGVRDYPLNFTLQPMKPAKPSKLAKVMKSSDYIAEEKIDGCHYFSIGGRIFSTRVSVKDGIPVEKTRQAEHLATILKQGGDKLILDGEIYLPGRKSQDVVSIMGSNPDVALAKQKEDAFVQYKVFDILRDPNGKWVTNQPWSERRKLLQACIEHFHFDPSFVQISPVVEKDKERFLEEVLDRGGEGIVLKHIGKPYICGKRPAWNWIKCKVEIEDDVVIMGFEPPEKLYTGKDVANWTYWEGSTPVTRYWHHGWIGAIIFGKYDREGRIVRLGTCSGMTDEERAAFSAHPEKYIGRVIKIKAMERTRDGAYRHCSFKGLHPDKNAHECIGK